MEIKKNRVRILKIYVGRTESSLNDLKGQLMLTIVAASSRVEALKKLKLAKLKCSRRELDKWSVNDKTTEYAFITKEGVWQSKTNRPIKNQDFLELK